MGGGDNELILKYSCKENAVSKSLRARNVVLLSACQAYDVVKESQEIGS